jgi:membrane protease YdiL (CAAX protease family)
VVILALGTILPSQWFVERMEITLPESTEKLFESIMGEPLGYVAIGILAPLVEELVFRGAILRTLLKLFDRKWHWVPIVISALIFGAVHMNVPQFVHAALIGLLLGWMYYRTDSIVPGVAFHWVNNTVAFVMFHMMPQMNDGKLIDLFHGNHTTMMLSLLFSLCIFLPALFQLTSRLKRAE